MITSITKIGNSKGVIIPVALLKQCGFGDKISMEIRNGEMVISRLKKPREGWEEAFIVGGSDEEELLVEGIANEFDQDEWSW